MFKQDVKTTATVEIILDGQNTTVPGDVSVAAALLTIGKITARRSPTTDEPRSPHCLMGICFECLMEINGIKRQSCMTEVQEGMIINRRVKEGKGAE